MESHDLKMQVVTSWIASLATSVVCCSVLFVVFAGYLTDIKKSIAAEDMRLVQIVLTQQKMLGEVQSMHRVLDSNSPKPAPVKQ
jgi:hypothetical protein